MLLSQAFHCRLVLAASLATGVLIGGPGCGSVSSAFLDAGITGVGDGEPGDTSSDGPDDGCPQNVPSAATLRPANPIEGEHFGNSIAAANDTVAVGAKDSSRAGPSMSGAVIVFERHGKTWSPSKPVMADDAAAGDNFGYSVALSDAVLVVGAPFSTTTGVQTGAIYIFTRAADASWKQTAKLTSPAGGGLDLFGTSVAIDDGRIVVGAIQAGDIQQGIAFVYAFNDAQPRLEATLQASDGTSNAKFGSAVAISGNRVLVGAPSDSRRVQAAGSAYVFERDAQGWNEKAKLVVDDPASADFFGFSVALSQDTAAIGAYTKKNTAGSAVGAVYIFDKYVFGNMDSEWLQKKKIVTADGISGDFFGISIALRGGLLAIGATGDDSASMDTGAIHLFHETSGSWQPQTELHAAAPSESAGYGQTVALSDSGFVATGAWRTNAPAAAGAGSAELQPLLCPQQPSLRR